MNSFVNDLAYHHNQICLHGKLVPYHDDYGAQKCFVCKKLPKYGMMYRCAVNKNIDLTELDFMDFEEEMRKYNIGPQRTTNDSSIGSKSGSNVNAPVSRDELAYSRPSAYRSRQTTVAACDFKVCHGCRPAPEERTWQSIHGFLETASHPLSTPEIDSPTIAEARVLAEMNRNQHLRYYRQFPPHLIEETRSPSVSTTEASEDDYLVAGKAGDETSTGKKISSTTKGPAVEQYDIDKGTIYDHSYYPSKTSLFVTNGSDNDNEDENDDSSDAATFKIRHDRVNTETPVTPSPPPSHLAGRMRNPRDSLNSNASTSSSLVKGQYYDEATIKAMRELERQKEMVLDLDEDSREKRAGRRLSKGRFFID